MKKNQNSKTMSNQRRKSLIPVLKRPVRTKPQPLLQIQQKSVSSQTEGIFFMKKEPVIFYNNIRWFPNNRGMEKDYTKAVTHIDASHDFINKIIDKNHLDKSEMFHLPVTINYCPRFTPLIEKTRSKERSIQKPRQCKGKRNFKVRKTTELPPEPIPGKDVTIF